MIATLLRRAAERVPHATALERGATKLSYAEVVERVARFAGALRARGLERGDRIAVLAPNSILCFEAYFAAAWAGLVLVPLNTRAHPRGLRRLVEHAGARALIAHRSFLAAAEELGRPLLDGEEEGRPCDVLPCDVDTPAQIYYTSGTTGEPKGVVLTHGNVTAHAEMARRALGLGPSDTFGHIAPMFHLADAWATFAVTLVGGCHRLVDPYEPRRVLDELAGGITLTNLVPTMLGDLVRHPAAERAYPALRLMLSGGAPIAPALVERVLDCFGCDYVQTYGLTETSPFLTMSILPDHLARLPRAERLPFLCKTGRPLEGVELRVIRDDGEAVEPNGTEVGEILARGPTVTPGYWRNDEATREAFTEGWLRTGDLAVVDAEGFVHIVDRRKDVILSGGETIYSTEIEHVLAAHPAVREAAVVGIPHERWGEAVVAFVVTTTGAADLMACCRAALGPHQLPKRIVELEALPRTGSGKIEKRRLRERYRDLFG